MGRKNNSTLISEERIKINIINNKEVFVMNTYRTHKKLFKNGLLFGALLLGIGLSFKEATPAKAVTANFNGPVYRLYNPNSGEHVYTMELTEKNNLVSLGWGYEGILGTSYYTMNGQSYDKIPVYRLYSKNSGEHLYTINTNEVNQLKIMVGSMRGLSSMMPLIMAIHKGKLSIDSITQIAVNIFILKVLKKQHF